MSGDAEKDNKTEEPTEKRRSDTLAREGGPFSREPGSAAVLLVLSALLATAASGLFSDLARSLAIYIENPGDWRLENSEDAVRLLLLAGTMASHFLWVFVAAIGLAALAASILQNAPRFVLNRIAPDFSRVSLSAGLGRLFNVQAVVEFVKGLVKTLAVAFAVYAMLGGAGTGLIALHSTPDAIPELIRHLCLRIGFFCALMACVIAAVDVYLTRRTWSRNLMMTKQEVKDELKQMEGDAAFKARLRTLARSRIRRRMMANVPKATLVVANPTHYAVALRYVRKEDSAPKVLAKGQDKIALRIRELAKLNNVPVVEDKALARSLFESVEVEQLIPSEFYKAVAEIIIFLESRRGKGTPKKEGRGLGKLPRDPISPA